jgi:ABC-type glutathione transport system ATPase component
MSQTPLLEIRDLSVGLKGDKVAYDIVRNINLSIFENEIFS